MTDPWNPEPDASTARCAERTTVEERMRWLREILELAQRSGALQIAHEQHRRQNDGGPWPESSNLNA